MIAAGTTGTGRHNEEPSHLSQLAHHDPGFEERIFAEMLDTLPRLTDDEFSARIRARQATPASLPGPLPATGDPDDVPPGAVEWVSPEKPEGGRRRGIDGVLQRYPEQTGCS